MNQSRNAAEKADAPSAQSANVESLTKLLPFARPYVWQFVLVLILVIIFNATSVLQPYLVKVAIDKDIATKVPNPHGLQMIGLAYIGVVVVGVIANYGQIQLLQYAGQSVIRAIRLELFRHIERQSMAFFDSNAIGRLVNNVSSDTETVSQFFTQFFLSLIRDGLSIVMILVAMFELDARIAGVSMVLIPILFGISLAFRSKLRGAYQATRTRLSNIVAFLAENLAGMRIIQIFHQEPRQGRAFENLNNRHREANVREYGISVMLNRTLDFLGNAAVAAMVWLGGGAVLHKLILFGTLYAFITYIRQFFGPINAITQQWNTLQSSMVAADRIGRVFAVEPKVVDPLQPVPASTVNNIQGDIAFHDVSFEYLPDEPVLKNIDFHINPGSFVGFVGATGAGKSSIMSLLARFYDPTEGSITIDGTDLREFRQADLHRLIGLVQQEVYLFTGSVADNIRLFRKEITDETVRMAAETVGADEVIKRLPEGYETKLYGKGANLSMGERQLISFARIVALNPKILILDEATANLDSQTEEWVQRGLAAVAQSRTTLVIAHRLSTVRHADKIIVLDRGRIMEEGPHEALLRRGGLYANLYEKSGIEDNNLEMAHTTAN